MDTYRKPSNHPSPMYSSGLKSQQNLSGGGPINTASPSPGASSGSHDEQQTRMKQSGTPTVMMAPSTSSLQQAAFAFHPAAALVGQAMSGQPQFDPRLQQQFVAQMQQNSQLHPQMIIAASQLPDLRGMHLPDPSLQYFSPNFLPAAMTRSDEVHRPGVLYPINTIFMSNEEKNCCLIDRGARCQRPAGPAGFTKAIRDQVARNGALLTEDTMAGHQYICDYHKNYIQKLRLLMPAPNYLPTSHLLTNPHHPGISSYFHPFPSLSPFAPPYVVESASPHTVSSMPSKAEDLSLNGDHEMSGRANVSPPHKPAPVENRSKESAEPVPVPAPVDMRKPAIAAESRTAVVSVSPDADEENSSEEEYDSGPAGTDLLFGLGENFSSDDLTGYIKHFDMEIPGHHTRDELTRTVCEHMDSVPVSDPKSILTHFFHAVKTDQRAFNQPYKPPLCVDFDLSSDEEMLVIDGKDGINGALSSLSEPDIRSETDDEGESEMGEEMPEIHFDGEVQRALSDMNGRTMTVSEIERILEKYSLPAKYTNCGPDSDTESSDSEEHRVGKRGGVRARKRRRLTKTEN